MSALRLNKSTLHCAILRYLMDHGFAPGNDGLAAMFGASAEDIARTLSALQDDHGVVLHPHRRDVWVIHPFSTGPTCFVVRQGERLWWGNCAWCSLGIAALLGGNHVSIESRFGADGDPITIHVEDAR